MVNQAAQWLEFMVKTLKCRKCRHEFYSMADITIKLTTKSTPQRSVVLCKKCNRYQFDSNENEMKDWFKARKWYEENKLPEMKKCQTG